METKRINKKIGTITGEGQRYEVKIAMWMILRAFRNRCDFTIACNAENVGIFDDIIFDAPERQQKIIMQLKHHTTKEYNFNFLTENSLIYDCYRTYVTLKALVAKKKVDILGKVDDFKQINCVLFTCARVTDELLENHHNNDFLSIDYCHHNQAKRLKGVRLYYGIARTVLINTFNKRKNDLVQILSMFDIDISSVKDLPKLIKKLSEEQLDQILAHDDIAHLIDKASFNEFMQDFIVYQQQPREHEMDMLLIDEINDLSDYPAQQVFNELLEALTKWHERSLIALNSYNFYTTLQHNSGHIIKEYFNRLGDTKPYMIERKLLTQNGKKFNFTLRGLRLSSVYVIAGEAGMGKTTYINHLSQMYHPKMWLIKIKFNDLYGLLNKVTIDYEQQAVEFLLRIIGYQNESKRQALHKKLIERKGIVLLMDGFDEICPRHEDVALTWLKYLTGKCVMVITTRNEYRALLRAKLFATLYTITELDDEDCAQFIKKYLLNKFNCSKDDERLDNFVAKLQSFINNKMFDNIMLGIPLQMQMLLEYFKENFNTTELSLNINSLFDFYTKFMNEKVDIYLRRLCLNEARLDSYLINLKRDIEKLHRFFAITSLNRDLFTLNRFSVILSNEDIIKVGLIDYFSIDGCAVFIHRTFAEYYYALFLHDNLKHRRIKLLIVEYLNQADTFMARLLQHLLVDSEAIYINFQQEFFAIRMSISKSLKRNSRNEKLDRFGYIKLLEVMLQLERDFIITDNDFAIDYEHFNQIKLLINNKPCKIYSKKAFNHALLRLAMYYNHTNTMRFLITYKCRTNHTFEDGKTALHLACEYGQVDGVRALTKRRLLTVTIKDRRGCTAMHYAATHGYDEIIAIFIKLHCNVDVRNGDGMTLLHCAARHGHGKIVHQLVKTESCRLNSRDDNRCTALHHAVNNSHADVVRLLLKYKIDANAKNIFGKTALHCAVDIHNPRIVDILVSHTLCELNVFDFDRLTPLHYAVQLRSLDVIKLLIDCERCDINKRGNFGCTPLHLAAEKGYKDVVALLIEKEHCNVNAENLFGCKALYYAKKHGFTEVKMLLADELYAERCSRDDKMANIYVQML